VPDLDQAYRDSGDPAFTDDDLALLAAVSWTAGAREWAHALPAASIFSAWGVLPAVMYPAGVLARSGSDAKLTHALDRTTFRRRPAGTTTRSTRSAPSKACSADARLAAVGPQGEAQVERAG
jgi:hypothetical protein